MPTETVLVTGASSGIGLELARCFARDGAALWLVARSADRLEALAAELRRAHGVAAHALPCDLADPAAPQALFDRLAAEGAAVDVLVNNAAFGQHGAFAEVELGRHLDLIQVNVTALTALSRLFLPGMVARRRGGLLNVASLAGYAPGPFMASYYASKAYVLSLSQALAEETAAHGVTVSCLAPGPVDTPFHEEAGTRRAVLGRAATLEAAAVARAGYRGFRRGQAVVVLGVLGKVARLGIRLVPGVVTRKTVRLLHHQTGTG